MYKYIIIIIKLHRLHWFPWLSVTIHPHYPLLPAGLPNYFLCSCRVVLGKFLPVGQHWHNHVKVFIGVSDLWVYPCFSRNVLLYLDGFRDGRLVALQLLFHGELLPGYLFNIARSVLVQFLSSFSLMRFIRFHVLCLYINITTASKICIYIYCCDADKRKTRGTRKVW